MSTWLCVVAFLLLEVRPIQQTSLVPDSTSKPQDYDIKILCFSISPQYLKRKAARDLSFSLFVPHNLCSVLSFIHPITVHLASPSTVSSFEEWACGYSCVPGNANSLFFLMLLELGLKLICFWLMRHLFCTTKQLRNTFLIPMNCVTKLIMRWPALIPGRIDQVSKAKLNNCLLEFSAGGNKDSEPSARGLLRHESDIQSHRFQWRVLSDLELESSVPSFHCPFSSVIPFYVWQNGKEENTSLVVW